MAAPAESPATTTRDASSRATLSTCSYASAASSSCCGNTPSGVSVYSSANRAGFPYPAAMRTDSPRQQELEVEVRRSHGEPPRLTVGPVS